VLVFNCIPIFLIKVTVGVFGVDLLILFLCLLQELFLDFHIVPVDRLEIFQVYLVSLS
jgi:hypothetical protein